MENELEMRKQRLLKDLEDLEYDCKLLLEKIPLYKEEVMKVTTEEEAEEFDTTHNLEEGLKF